MCFLESSAVKQFHALWIVLSLVVKRSTLLPAAGSAMKNTLCINKNDNLFRPTGQ